MEGIVKGILTNSPTHRHGIKVRLMDGKVGRVQEVSQIVQATKRHASNKKYDQFRLKVDGNYEVLMN